MMNTPSFRPSDLPFNPKGLPERNQRRKAVGSVLSRKTLVVLDLLHRKPHVTIQVENLDETPIKELGSSFI